MMMRGVEAMERPTMRESECSKRLFSNTVCREVRHVVDHLRERLRVPPPTKKPIQPPKPKPEAQCSCGRPAVFKRRTPMVEEPTCKDCHHLIRYPFLKTARLSFKTRRDCMKVVLQSIRAAAKDGHAPSIAWLAKEGL